MDSFIIVSAAVGALIVGKACNRDGQGYNYYNGGNHTFALTIAGAVLGAALFGGAAAGIEAISNSQTVRTAADISKSYLKDIFSSQTKPSDIEQCAAAAPPGSKINFTRNADGSSVCSYEMK